MFIKCWEEADSLVLWSLRVESHCCTTFKNDLQAFSMYNTVFISEIWKAVIPIPEKKGLLNSFWIMSKAQKEPGRFSLHTCTQLHLLPQGHPWYIPLNKRWGKILPFFAFCPPLWAWKMHLVVKTTIRLGSYSKMLCLYIGSNKMVCPEVNHWQEIKSILVWQIFHITRVDCCFR